MNACHLNFNVVKDTFLILVYSDQQCKFFFCTENRGEFVEKLQKARSQIRVGTMSQPIVSKPDAVSLIVGNWVLMCRKVGEMQIHNSDGQQVHKFFCSFQIIGNIYI